MSEPRQHKIRRLIFKSRYSGARETALLLGAFAESELASMTDNELDDYEALLTYGDMAIWEWVSGKVAIPHEVNNSALVKLIKWSQK